MNFKFYSFLFPNMDIYIIYSLILDYLTCNYMWLLQILALFFIIFLCLIIFIYFLKEIVIIDRISWILYTILWFKLWDVMDINEDIKSKIKEIFLFLTSKEFKNQIYITIIWLMLISPIVISIIIILKMYPHLNLINLNWNWIIKIYGSIPFLLGIFIMAMIGGYLLIWYLYVIIYIEIFIYIIWTILYIGYFAFTGEFSLEYFMMIFYPRKWIIGDDPTLAINSSKSDILYMMPIHPVSDELLKNIGLQEEVLSPSELFKLNSLELEFRNYYNISENLEEYHCKKYGMDHMLDLLNYNQPTRGVYNVTWDIGYGSNLFSRPWEGERYLNPNFLRDAIPKISNEIFKQTLFYVKSLSQFDKFILSTDTFADPNGTLYNDRLKNYMKQEHHNFSMQLQKQQQELGLPDPTLLKTLPETVSLVYLIEAFGYKPEENRFISLYNSSMAIWHRNKSEINELFSNRQNYVILNENESENIREYSRKLYRINMDTGSLQKPIYKIRVFPENLPDDFFVEFPKDFDPTIYYPDNIKYKGMLFDKLKNAYTYMLTYNLESIANDDFKHHFRLKSEDIEHIRCIITLSPKYVTMEVPIWNEFSIAEIAKKSARIKVYTDAWSRNMVRDSAIILTSFISK